MVEMAGDWTDQQNDAIVADYFALLADEGATSGFLNSFAGADIRFP